MKKNRKKVYNKLSDEYDFFYINGIRNFLDETNNNEYCLFYPSFGIKKEEKCDFLIYGQALNGWHNTKVNSSTNINLNEIVLSFNEYLFERNHTPLDWVNVFWTKSDFNECMEDEVIEEYYFYDEPYFTYRSFFWNVSYKLVSTYFKFKQGHDFGWNWSKKMVWSNLYKIAPIKGNPNDQLKKAQFEFCAELFKKELEEIKPKFCIVFTNQKWFDPFQKHLGLTNIFEKESEVITSVYRFNSTKIIVTNRPFQGDSNFYVQEILKELN